MQIVYVCGYNKRASGGVQGVFPGYVVHMSECASVSVLNFGGAAFKFPDHVQVWNDEKEVFSCKEINLVVFHEVYYLKYYSFAKMLFTMHIPYIIIPHGSFTKGAQSQKKYAKKIFNFLWVDKFVKRARAIQFLSEGEWKNSVYAKKEHFIIPNGIEITKNYKSLFKSQNGMKLIFIGRLSIFYKGLDLLIEACGMIKDEMEQKNISLDIYGTDFENGRKKLMDQVASLGLKGRVAIYEGVFGKKKENVILQHDVFIQASRYEGQPMGILEAMQYGMPLIVTPGTTFASIVEDAQCGWRVEENERNIADGILQAYADRDKWKIFSQNARKHALDNYSWNHVKRKTIQEYQKYGFSENSSADDSL